MSEDIYQLYLDEIEQIPCCNQEENVSLAVLLSKGDERAKKRLVEGNLKAVLAYVEEYKDRGVVLSDLAQEASMALMLAVESYSTLVFSESPKQELIDMKSANGAFEQFLEFKIKEALKAAVEEQEDAARSEEEVLARVNVLKDVAQRMAEELGREATVEELADKMMMTVDAVKEVMKLTLEAFSVAGEFEL